MLLGFSINKSGFRDSPFVPFLLTDLLTCIQAGTFSQRLWFGSGKNGLSFFFFRPVKIPGLIV